MKIRLNLDYKQYKNKPASSEVATIRNRLATATTEIELEDFLKAIENGQTFTPAVMTGTKSDTWQSQQIIVADIDNDGEALLNVGEALDTAQTYNIDPFIYYSFSNTEDHPKYRLVVILSELITNADEARDLTERFTNIFNLWCPNCADTKICDNARLIFGSREGSIIHRGEVTPLDVMRNLPARTHQNASQSESVYDIAQEAVNATQRTTERHDTDFEFDIPDMVRFLAGTDIVDDYDKWRDIGMALQYEGYSWQDWDSWSRSSLKYKEGDCEKKWRSFSRNGNGKKVITGKTITHYAKEYGYFTRQTKPVKTTPTVTREVVPDPTDNDAPPVKPTSFEPVTPPEPPTPEPTPLDALEQFYGEIQSNRFEPIPTGIEQLDKALQGGLERRTLVTLAAAPGMSKTAISQYILENMAKDGHPVVYVNLEMDRAQLLSRSISRISHHMRELHIISDDVTALDVKRGYKWTPEQRKIVEYCMKYYGDVIAKNFYYVTTNPENVGSITNRLSDILRKLEKITDELRKQGRPAPLVCIDYLQFIDFDMYEDGQRKPDNADAIKQTLAALKNFAMNHDTVVLVITANNRVSNAEGRASIDSGRDTSNIEYSGDVMLSLVYTAIEEKWKYKKGTDKAGNDTAGIIDNDFINEKIDYTLKMKGEYPLIAKLLSLKVVKGRSIMSRGVAKFIYNGAYYHFTDDTGTPNPYWLE